MIRGLVKSYDDFKGYGTIESDSGEKIFVHCSTIETKGFKSLTVGEVVRLEYVAGEKGPHAVRVLKSQKKKIIAKGSR